MALYAQLADKPSSSMADLEHAMDGNLCRCTGYRPIIDAGKMFAVDFDPAVSGMDESGQRLCRDVRAKYAATLSPESVFPAGECGPMRE